MGIEDVCPVFGKTFFHGSDWGYRVKDAYHGKLFFGRAYRFYICSYPCFGKYKQAEYEYKRKR